MLCIFQAPFFFDMLLQKSTYRNLLRWRIMNSADTVAICKNGFFHPPGQCTIIWSLKIYLLNLAGTGTGDWCKNDVASISMVLALTITVLSIIGVAITGLYPGIIVLMLVALIPIASKFYAKRIISRSNDFQRRYFTTLTFINLLSILVVLWMTFVIVHDRVLQDCCWFLRGGI